MREADKAAGLPEEKDFLNAPRATSSVPRILPGHRSLGELVRQPPASA